MMAENARLKQKLSAFEIEIVQLLRQAQGSLSELGRNLAVLNDMDLDLTAVDPDERTIDTVSDADEDRAGMTEDL
jgi:hypothetical protein